jgi:hypothetical protein
VSSFYCAIALFTRCTTAAADNSIPDELKPVSFNGKKKSEKVQTMILCIPDELKPVRFQGEKK